MSDNIILAKIKRNKNNFEIVINPDRALEFKQGKIDNINQVLEADEIFSDAKKGLKVSDSELEAAFNTTNTEEIAKIIINEGEIQLTAKHRAQQRQNKLNQLITKIHSLATDPKTNLPHPRTRIESALTQAKIHLKDHQTIEGQFDNIIKQLRPILPIKISTKTLYIQAAAQHVGKLGNYIRSELTLKKEEWTNQGNWAVLVEAPAGLVPDIIDKINQITKGDASIDIRDE